MPPKKKEPEKKGAVEMQPDEGEKELLEKELVISYLKSKLGRYQEQGENLQVENIKLTEELENQKLDLSHINEFLTNELKARSLTTTVLEEKLADLSAVLEETKRNHEVELQRLRAEKDREMGALESSVQDYDRKFRMTQDFLDRRDALEAELQQLRDSLEKRHREYEQKLRNQKLLNENTSLHRQLELSKQTEIELAKRNHVYQKTIKTLLSKLKVQGEQAELEDDLVEGVLKRRQELEEELRLSQLQVRERQAQLDMAQGLAVEKKDHLEQLLSSFDEITRFLTLCKYDVEQQVKTLHDANGASIADQSAQEHQYGHAKCGAHAREAHGGRATFGEANNGTIFSSRI